MLDVFPSGGADRCLACDATPTVRAHVALDRQLCRDCLAAVPCRLTRLNRMAGANAAWSLSGIGHPLSGMAALARGRGDEALLWALGRHCGWVDGLPTPDGIAALPPSPWSRVARGVSPHDVVACSLAAFLGLPLLAPFSVRRAHQAAAGARECVQPIGPVEGIVLLVADTLPAEDRLATYVSILRASGADEVYILGVTARGPTAAPMARALPVRPVPPVRRRARPAPETRVRAPFPPAPLVR